MEDSNRRLQHFKPIEVLKPSEIIVRQIRNLIVNGVLKPGDRLPSERELSEKFGVGRGHVREAIKKLEFYGILKTEPQSGTTVSSIGVRALEGLFSNVLNLEKEDFASLMDTRDLLEKHSARLAAERATDEEIAGIVQAHEDFLAQVKQGNDGLEEDLLFHLRIAESSHSSVLCSLISLMTPEILTLTRDLQVFGGERSRKALEEHDAVLKALTSRDPDAAEGAMEHHMEGSRERGKQNEKQEGE
jgi:GntR family transcriptional repressor for pyruvate dehydrogenase complex